MKPTIFTPADVLLPYNEPDNPGWNAWSVIACDQFTSEPEYWETCERLSDGAPSSYRLMLPEAYLGTDKEEIHRKTVAESMRCVGSLLPVRIPDTLIYVERRLPDGRIRRGIVGKVDLERYDYSVGSGSAVRATEATVLERIPPRCAVRAEAAVELPHVMLFGDSEWSDVIAEARNFAYSGASKKIYDFELMQGGGHLTGYTFSGDALSAVTESVAGYEAGRPGSVIYAVGDGNHSLAAAKAHFENLKAELGEAAMKHPARYALTEVVSLGDDSIEFEPIYRLVKNCDRTDLISAFREYAKRDGDVGIPCQMVRIVCGAFDETVEITHPVHCLTVGSLQIFLDEYLKNHPGDCDYIHGIDSLERLSESEGCVGFAFDGMDKGDLFGYVGKNGALPRKTFSMGEARSKRYYTEARAITETKSE